MILFSQLLNYYLSFSYKFTRSEATGTLERLVFIQRLRIFTSVIFAKFVMPFESFEAKVIIH